MVQDQAFLDELHKLRTEQSGVEYWRDTVDRLLENGIQSLDALYALIDNVDANITLRTDGISTLGRLCFKSYLERGKKIIIDKRRAEPIVLRALTSPIQEIAKSALWTLARLDTKRGNKIIMDIAFDRTDPRGLREAALWEMGSVANATSVEPLLTIMQDQTEQEGVRKAALISVSRLSCITDKQEKRIAQVFRELIDDETLSPSTRGDAIEQLSNTAFSQQYLSLFIALLDHDEVDLRFWAAYAIVFNARHYGMDVIPKLDQVIRNDHVALDHWWSVGREVLPAMDIIYYRHFVNVPQHSLSQMLISPEPEYDDYRKARWHWDESNQVWMSTQITRTSTLKIDPAWLADQIKSRWSDAEINDRDPLPESHLLTWRIKVKKVVLIGALLFDGYAITITSEHHFSRKYPNDILRPFTQWYRTIIPLQHPLYLYHGADEGELIELPDTNEITQT